MGQSDGGAREVWPWLIIGEGQDMQYEALLDAVEKCMRKAFSMKQSWWTVETQPEWGRSWGRAGGIEGEI